MDELTNDDDLDLSPRTSAETAAAAAKTKSWPFVLVLVLLFGGVGFLLVKGLSDASVFFRNVDEAVAEREELGEARFKIQGTVVPGSVVGEGELVAFALAFNDVVVDVVHRGDPAELFQEDVPLVLEGSFASGSPFGIDFVEVTSSADGYYYESDFMLIRHDNQYEAENEDRLDEADRGGQLGGADQTDAE